MIIVSGTKCLCRTDKYKCPELEVVDADVGEFFNCTHPEIIEKFGKKVHMDDHCGVVIARHDCPYKKKNKKYVDECPLNDELIVACEIFYHNLHEIPISYNDLKVRVGNSLKLLTLVEALKKLFDQGMLTTKMGTDESGEMERKFILSNESMWMVAPLYDKYYKDRALDKVDVV